MEIKIIHRLFSRLAAKGEVTFFDPLPRREAFESYRRTLNANRHCLQLRIFKPPSAADHEALHKVVTLAPDRGRISSWNLIADNVY